jgi:hypothetical protein
VIFDRTYVFLCIQNSRYLLTYPNKQPINCAAFEIKGNYAIAKYQSHYPDPDIHYKGGDGEYIKGFFFFGEVQYESHDYTRYQRDPEGVHLECERDIARKDREEGSRHAASGAGYSEQILRRARKLEHEKHDHSDHDKQDRLDQRAMLFEKFFHFLPPSLLIDILFYHGFRKMSISATYEK